MTYYRKEVNNDAKSIVEAMRCVIEDSGANLRIVIDELSQYLPQEYPNDNESLN